MGEKTGKSVGAGRRLGGLGCWLVSAALHAVCLGALAFVHFPSGGGTADSASGSFSVSESAARLRMPEPTFPKPQIRPLKTERVLPSLERMKVPSVHSSGLEPSPASIPFRLSEDLTGPSVSFFGACCSAERICFVVDCSGSMFGRMGLVRRQLTEAVSRLTPDQFFSVLFFGGGGRIWETGAGELRRAVPAFKQEAFRLVDSIRPEGRADALPALARAMMLKTAEGRGPDLIYFLTDGFDLTPEGTARLADRAEGLRKKLAPQSVIHTIAFWASAADREVLRTIAEQSGGCFTCVDYEPEGTD